MNEISKIIITAWWIFLLPAVSHAQEKIITLDSCYIWAQQNYPLVKQYALLEKSNSYSLQNIGKGHFPQIQIIGQASYQSDVTAIPIDLPGITIPELGKDQYKVYAELNLPVYDGGLSSNKKRYRKQATRWKSKV